MLLAGDDWTDAVAGWDNEPFTAVRAACSQYDDFQAYTQVGCGGSMHFMEGESLRRQSSELTHFYKTFLLPCTSYITRRARMLTLGVRFACAVASFYAGDPPAQHTLCRHQHLLGHV